MKRRIVFLISFCDAGLGFGFGFFGDKDKNPGGQQKGVQNPIPPLEPEPNPGREAAAMMSENYGSVVTETEETLNRGFDYRSISKYILGDPNPSLDHHACRQACLFDTRCVAWETCLPLGNGCDGCYLISQVPDSGYVKREFWHAEILPDRAQKVQREELNQVANATLLETGKTFRECANFLIETGNDDIQSQGQSAVLKEYDACVWKLFYGSGNSSLLRFDETTEEAEESRKRLFAQGIHYPTFMITNHRGPSIRVPFDIEKQFVNAFQELVAPGTPPPELHQSRNMESEESNVVNELHRSSGTFGPAAMFHRVFETRKKAAEKRDEERAKGEEPQDNYYDAPHSFILPAYDLSYSKQIRLHGVPDVLQSWEIQSLLRPGDTMIDSESGLGVYASAFAEKVGPRGRVITFQPHRHLSQIVNGNAAVNGLKNVHVIPVTLGPEYAVVEIAPPQLRFFSSLEEVKVLHQDLHQKSKIESAELYDHDAKREIVTVLPMDEILFQSPRNAEVKERTTLSTMFGLPPQLYDIRLIRLDMPQRELEFLAGARNTILHFKPMIFWVRTSEFPPEPVLNEFQRLEYTCQPSIRVPDSFICRDALKRGQQPNQFKGGLDMTY